MPIYTYHCDKCNEEIDVRVPVDDRDDPGLHACGSPMVRKLPRTLTPIIRTTARGMAMDNLNNDTALPNRWYKDRDQKGIAMGLEKQPKTVW